MAQDSPQAKYSEQYILNNIYEQVLKAIAVVGVGYDGVNTQVPVADSLAVKVTESGTTTYVATAAPGTAQATAKWRCLKVDESSGTVITWADGDPNFDNVATDLTALTYS